VSYDCPSGVLTVTGVSDPGQPLLDVQVQARTPAEHLTPVWGYGTADARGEFRVAGKYPAAAIAGGTIVTVRAGAVVSGSRVFSAKVKQEVRCR
jgi:hypothetical protein